VIVQDERITRRVGALTLLLGVAAIVFVVFIYDQIELRARTRIDVYFTQTGGITEGSPVVLGGREVGTIESITLSPRDAPNTPLAGVEGVAVTIALLTDDAKRIPRGGDVFITSKGAIGARFLELGPSPTPDGASLADDARPILGRDLPSTDRVIQRTWDNLNIARAFGEAVRPELDTLRAALGELRTTLDQLSPNLVGVAGLGVEVSALVDEARTLRDVGLGGEPGRQKIDTTIADTRALLARAKTALDTLRGKATLLAASSATLRARLGERGPKAIAAIELTIERIRNAIDKVDPLLAKIDEINTRIARGEGSLGKLAKDPEFPEDAKALGKYLKRHPWKVFERPKD
jgi:phospholipid/cholesterol/gamma-HCH transport system substrate-binding protein